MPKKFLDLSPFDVVALGPDTMYSIAECPSSVSGATQTLSPAANRVQSATQAAGVSTVSLVMPPFPGQGLARDFLLVLTCGSTPPEVELASFGRLKAASSSALELEEGDNALSFTELPGKTFMVSRILLTEVAAGREIETTADLLAAMSQSGVDTSSFTTMGQVRTALGLPATAAVGDAVQAANNL